MKNAQVYRSDGSIVAVPSDGVLEGERALAGVRVALAELFE
jgi:hypothetical protein